VRSRKMQILVVENLMLKKRIYKREEEGDKERVSYDDALQDMHDARLINAM
jgi:hypothetical protein